MIRKYHLLSVIIFFTVFSCFSDSRKILINYKPDIEEYVTFLQKQHQNPVDYVMDLFEKSDIIILCERAHPEVTQYDLILELVSDKRFINKVGHVFTEIGSSSIDSFIKKFMSTANLSEKEIEEKVCYIYQNLYYREVWENTNFYNFLKKVYHLNNALPQDKRINIYPSNMPFNWQGMTKEKYQTFRKTLGQRDRVMADQIIAKYKEIIQSKDKRKKALVIMNYRHAFMNFIYADGTRSDNVGEYISEAFPGRVSNVMINSLKNIPGSADRKIVATAIQDGKWDAAFAALGNPDIGFNFKDSPFGQDYFDYFIFRKHHLKYQDVFTGFIFYKPLKEQKALIGIPGLFDPQFTNVLLERFEITGRFKSTDEAKQYIEFLKTLREYNYDTLNEFPYIEVQKIEYENKINNWLIEN
jgi:hypothetical protein